jgi:hypothetical protein
MKRISAAASMLLFSLHGAFALPGVMGEATGSGACYQRTYAAAHLQANPKQRTTSMLVSFRMERYGGAVESVPPLPVVRIEVARRNVAAPLRAIGTCMHSATANRDTSNRRMSRTFPGDAGVICPMAADMSDEESGSQTLFAIHPGGIELHVEDTMPMRRTRKLSEGPSRNIGFGGADGAFRLTRVADSECSALNKSIASE